MDNTAGPRVLPLPQSQGHDAIPEVMRLSIPVPRLNISLTEKTPGPSIADATRAYVRDAKKYLQAVHGGDNDGIRCLFVGNTLEGSAKDWYREWTTARGEYTFDEMIAALLTRFATEVQARDVEARKVLAAGSYHMRRGENVPAYQSHVEALVTPIADLTENERVFWFKRGLTKLLAKWCATDLSGVPFKSYDALVAFAKGTEIRLHAGEEEVKSAPRANAVQVQDPLGEAVALDQELGATRPAPTATTRRSNRQRKARGGASSGVHGSGGAGPSSDPAKSRKRGGAPSLAAAQRSDPNVKRTRMDDSFMPKWNCNRSEFERRKAANVCLRCAESHPTKDCPLLPPFVPQPK
ncbi:hypothetical protein VaNZ11_007097 [Volvox africanus]|uniref:Retrotransposon gag domain-containing protein n=1 Tax=Volvox africanus TaxID=51714 RepID=A0ABQ5S3I6_9CHLO|nr:hypothetical protein VaNZ11_007097 [Volvox africanus]